MLSLSNTTGYAVHALVCLTRCNAEWYLAKDVSACSGVPLAYLQKVLAQLRDAGLVEGKRGYRGGFRLARPAEEITMMEVAEIVDSEIREPKCLLGLKACSDEDPCPSHAFWKEGRKRLFEELQRLTIGEIADFGFPTLVDQGGEGNSISNSNRSKFGPGLLPILQSDET